MAKATCSTNDCDRLVKALGLCQRHYQRSRYGNLGACSAEGCDSPVKALGLCNRHYMESLAEGRACSVLQCPKPPRVRGLCSMHYYRWNKTGDPGEATPQRKPPRTCVAPNCVNPAVGRDDLCMTHHLRVKEHGSLEGRLCHCGTKAMRGSALCPAHYETDMMEKFATGRVGGSRRHGYVVRKILDHDVLQHRAVMEWLLGRRLWAFEVPHHKNGIRHDNRPENLELWVTPHPAGQRPEDLVDWVLQYYPDLVAARMPAAA